MRRNDTPERIGKEKTVQRGAIPFLAGRPERDSAISTDDLTNLVIALYTSKTLEEFLKKT